LLEKAWLASKEIGNEFVEDIIKIVKMRNDIAIDLGYSNFHEMSLKLNEQEPIDILGYLTNWMS
jgi:peptidyl-dipeptidase A